MRRLPFWVFLALLGSLFLGGGAVSAAEVGRVTGRVELVPGVPATNVLVALPGVARASRTDDDGMFDIQGVAPGERTLRVILDPDGPSREVLPRIIPVPVNPGQITYVGSIVVSQPGWIYGRVEGADPDRLATMIVHLADEPASATLPNAQGYFVLGNVPPGERQVILRGVWFAPGSRVRTVAVKPGEMTRLDFRLQPPVEIGSGSDAATPDDLEAMEGYSQAKGTQADVMVLDDEQPIQAEVKVSRCEGYALTAAAQIRQNHEQQCGFSGPRWSADTQVHRAWCASQSVETLAAETRGRVAQLRSCLRGRESAVGDDARCTQYAADAVYAVGLQSAHACGHSGARWSADFLLHYRWCHKQAGAEPESEALERGRLLTQCGVAVPQILVPGLPVPGR